MNKYRWSPFFGVALFFLGASDVIACKAEYFLESSQVYPDGGSIELILKTRCGEKLLVEQRSSLQDRLGKTFVNGEAVIPGREEEVRLLSDLDQLVSKAQKGKSLKNLIDLQQKNYLKNSKRSFLPLIGLLQVICINDSSRAASRDVCEKYKAE